MFAGYVKNGWKIIGYYTDDGDVYFGMTNNVTIVPAEDNALLDLSTWYDLMGYGKGEKDNKGITLNEAAIGVSAISLSNNVKSALIDWAMEGADWGKSFSRYIKVVRGVNLAGSVFGMGVSGYNIYTDYTQGGIDAVNAWDVADFGVGAVGIGATIFMASNPIGWGIGLGTTIYFGVRFVYDISTKP